MKIIYDTKGNMEIKIKITTEMYKHKIEEEIEIKVDKEEETIYISTYINDSMGADNVPIPMKLFLDLIRKKIKRDVN